MIIIGLDPGLARCGFGIIDTESPTPFRRCGCLTTPAGLPETIRLADLGDSLTRLIAETNPSLAVIEQVFFGKNTKTAIQTAQARGVLSYIFTKHAIPVTSFTPLQIKSRLTGFGRAEKTQIQKLVQSRLKLSSLPQPDDAADALAAALCAWDNTLANAYEHPQSA